jgi:hypothetical protein
MKEMSVLVICINLNALLMQRCGVNIMDNPIKYYRRMLQTMACGLSCKDEQYLDEISIEKLEAFIMKKKEEVSEKNFYFDAGRIEQLCINCSKRGGVDSYNACKYGAWLFEHLIRLTKDNDDDG